MMATIKDPIVPSDSFFEAGQKGLLMAMENFHGSLSPGVILGGLMVTLGIELLGGFSDPAAVVETQCHLPDAVQVLTPCTVGNGRLVVLDWGKTAICLYDRQKQAGYRIWLDLKKVRKIPGIYNWQMHLPPGKPRRENPVIRDILSAGRSILSWRAVPITHPFYDRITGPMSVCPRCDEAYPESQGGWCRSCRGETYFELPEDRTTEASPPPCSPARS